MRPNIDIQEMLNRKARRAEILSSVLPFTGLAFVTILLIIVTKGVLIRESNLINILNQCFTVCLVAVGATFVYSHGGMDFSIGASAGLAQYILAIILLKFNMPIYVAVLASIIFGVIAATLVVSLSLFFRVPVFIGSMSVRSICSGLLAIGATAANREIVIDYAKYDWINNHWFKLATLITFIGLGYFLFEKTAIGKSEKAIGGNIATAYQSGVKVKKNMIIAYSFLGLCVGVAAVFQLTRIGYITANSGAGLEFSLLIALVLGGFPMAGGSTARLRSAIVGAITVTILNNGLIVWGLDLGIINGVNGLLFVIIVSLSFDRSNLKQMQLFAT